MDEMEDSQPAPIQDEGSQDDLIQEEDLPYANLQDVETTLGRRITERYEIQQVRSWIEDAALCIRLRLGSLDDLSGEVLRFVIKESVARRVRNPEGKTTERIDDYSYTLNADSARASLYILDEEWAMLSPRVGANIFPPPLTPHWWHAGGPGVQGGKELS